MASELEVGKVTAGGVEINGTTNVQLTDVANGGVNQVIMRHSRGTTASPTNSNANTDGNYISSQTYDSGYDTTSQIGMVTGSTSDSGKIIFNTAASGGSPQTRLTIASDGQTTMTAASTSVLKVNRTTSDGDAIIVEADGADRIRLGTEGITFPNGGTTAPGAGDANRLDYYKEGSWVPTLVRGGSAITAGVDYSNQAGNYTRIGKVVYYWFDMTISILDNNTLNPSSGIFGIGGLPFDSAAASAGGYGAPSFRSMTAIPTSIRNNNNSSFVQESSTYIALFWLNGSAAEIGLDTVTTDLTTGRLTGEGFYFTS